MAFRVGQKVVCIDDVPRHREFDVVNGKLLIGGMNGLKCGQVYTVRGFGSGACGASGIFLEEIVRPAHYLGEAPYYADRFRPLVERKTELPACITALFDPKNHPPAPVPVEKEKTHV